MRNYGVHSTQCKGYTIKKKIKKTKHIKEMIESTNEGTYDLKEYDNAFNAQDLLQEEIAYQKVFHGKGSISTKKALDELRDTRKIHNIIPFNPNLIPIIDPSKDLESEVSTVIMIEEIFHHLRKPCHKYMFAFNIKINRIDEILQYNKTFFKVVGEYLEDLYIYDINSKEELLNFLGMSRNIFYKEWKTLFEIIRQLI